MKFLFHQLLKSFNPSLMQLGEHLKLANNIPFIWKMNSPKSLVIQEDPAAVVTLKECRMDYCLEPNQYRHNYPSLEDLKTYQANDAQTLHLISANQIQNFLLDHLATQSACSQKHHHLKTPEQILANCHQNYFRFSSNLPNAQLDIVLESSTSSLNTWSSH